MTRLTAPVPPPIRKQKPKLGSHSDTTPVLKKIQKIQLHKLEEPEFIICPHGAMVWKDRGLCKYGCTLKGASTKGKKGKKENKGEKE